MLMNRLMVHGYEDVHETACDILQRGLVWSGAWQ